MKLSGWLRLLRIGDVCVIIVAATGVVVSARIFWTPDSASFAVVRAQGKLFARVPLDRPAHLEVTGPIGLTRIEIEPGRARVLSDPGSHQYCVRQGWLMRAGAIAICAPNQVSLALEGRQAAYDSMSY